MAIKPSYRPQAKLDYALKLIGKEKLSLACIVGVRGYYKNTMGKGVNSRNLYDDAIFILSPDAFLAFNANVDPSTYRTRIANLKKGKWLYKLGIHGLSKPKSQQYQALVQAGPVTVQRDNVGDDTGWFGINIHRGGYNSTSSLGCQTIYPDQWPSFIATTKDLMQRYNQKTIEYHLV